MWCQKRRVLSRYVFKVIDPETNRRLPLDEMLEFCRQQGLTTVPIEETGSEFDYTFDSLLQRGEGTYSSGMAKEGIVVRSISPRYSEALRGDLSFKVINNKFLLKDES